MVKIMFPFPRAKNSKYSILSFQSKHTIPKMASLSANKVIQIKFYTKPWKIKRNCLIWSYTQIQSIVVQSFTIFILEMIN